MPEKMPTKTQKISSQQSTPMQLVHVHHKKYMSKSAGSGSGVGLLPSDGVGASGAGAGDSADGIAWAEGAAANPGTIGSRGSGVFALSSLVWLLKTESKLK